MIQGGCFLFVAATTSAITTIAIVAGTAIMKFNSYLDFVFTTSIELSVNLSLEIVARIGEQEDELRLGKHLGGLELVAVATSDLTRHDAIAALMPAATKPNTEGAAIVVVSITTIGIRQ